MKLAWIIKGPPESAWSYYTQISLYSRGLEPFGYHSQTISFTNLPEDFSGINSALNTSHPDILITIGDVHLLDLGQILNLPLISIVTNGTGIVDLPLVPPNVTFACTSRFAQKLYRRHDLTATPYLPHAFDPAIFHPGSRPKARHRLGWTHPSPTILMLGTNYPLNPHDVRDNPTPDRKNFIGGLKAFAEILKSRPNTKLYLHTNPVGAVNLPREIKRLGLTGTVIHPTIKHQAQTINTMPQSYLTDLYTAANILLFPSFGESFGVPIIEAQACGLPVISTHAGPMTELIKTGSTIKTSPHPTFPGWGIPSIPAITHALLEWLDYDDPIKTSQSIQSYAINSIIKHHFLPLLKEVHGHR